MSQIEKTPNEQIAYFKMVHDNKYIILLNNYL